MQRMETGPAVQFLLLNCGADWEANTLTDKQHLQAYTKPEKISFWWQAIAELLS